MTGYWDPEVRKRLNAKALHEFGMWWWPSASMNLFSLVDLNAKIFISL